MQYLFSGVSNKPVVAKAMTGNLRLATNINLEKNSFGNGPANRSSVRAKIGLKLVFHLIKIAYNRG